MDAFSAVVGALQIVGQCAQCTIALAKYINQVVTVDSRIDSFYRDVSTLKSTYEVLEQSLASPQMVEAAKKADVTTGNLWSHLSTTLRDCENTLVAINHILGKINRPLGLSSQLRQIVERPLKQLQEQLNIGELGRHHEKIKMFNTSLALPMQVIHITIQLEQRELSTENQRRLEERLMTMQRTIESLHSTINELKHQKPLPSRSSTMSGATIIGTAEAEKAVCEHMETFASKATQFLSNASSAATTSGASTVHLATNPIARRGTSVEGTPLSHRQRSRINAWVPILPEDPNTSPNVAISQPLSATEYGSDNESDSSDLELDLVRTYFQNGQGDLELEDFAAAEENFIEALNVLKIHDFGNQLAFQQADVILLLAHCYEEQDKLDEAIDLLMPLTDANDEEGSGTSSNNSTRHIMHTDHLKTRPDYGRVLAAHHSLGIVYLKKKDYKNAEKHSVRAFKGRLKTFERNHEKTTESCQVVVDMYNAKGERAKARAYARYLKPEGDRRKSKASEGSQQTLTSQVVAPGQRNSLPNATAQTLERTQTMTTVPAIQLPPLSTIMANVHLSTTQSAETHGFNSMQSPRPSTLPDDASTVSSLTRSPRRSMSATPRNLLKPRFDAIKYAAVESKDRACEAAHHLLKSYDPDPSKILIHRWDDIKKNIRRQGAQKGLASSGLGYAPIHFFCDLKQEAITEVELLIEEGADLLSVRYKAAYGKQEPMTAFQLTIDRNHSVLAIMMMDALESCGVKPDRINALRDKDEFSPLLAACRRGQINTVARLLDYGANVSLDFPRLWCGNSLLHDACSRCDVDMVQFLLNFQQTQTPIRSHPRTDIGTPAQQDQFGRTPLINAVISSNIPDQSKREKKIKGRYSCVTLLLQHAEFILVETLFAQDSSRMDVLAYAADEGDSQLVSLLESYARRSRASEMSV